MPTDEELFPETITYQDLKIRHADYNPGNVIEKYDALYAGGQKFRDGIEKFGFLDKRQLDGDDGALATPRLDVTEPKQQLDAAARFAGVSRWSYKKKVGRYTNYVAGMLDFFVQGVFKNEPKLIGTDFWKAFCENTDGNGEGLMSILGGCLLDCLLCYRSYLSAYVPNVDAANRAEQRAKGGLDPKMSWLCAAEVDLWDYDGKKLLWVRTYKTSSVREKGFGNPTQTRELWTYITEKNILEYELTYPIGKPPADSTLVKRKPIKPHGFKALPVVPMRISSDLWAMQRLEDPVLALYNRETAATCLINDAAFQILTIATDTNPDKVPDMAMGALWVGLGGKADMIGPGGEAFKAQADDAAQKKNNLYEVFQAMGINALATQSQNARQSGDAKRLDKEPLYALMLTFAYAIKSALTQETKLIAQFRNEPEPALQWDIRNLNAQDLAQKFLNLLSAEKAQGFPQSARRHMLQDAALSACPDAPTQVLQDIVNECKTADLDAPPPVATMPPSEPAAATAEENSG